MSERTLNALNGAVSISVELDEEPEKARILADKLALPVVSVTGDVSRNPPPADAVRLRFRDGKLQALSLDQSGGQFLVETDFLNVTTAKRLLRARSELVVKAVQGRQKSALTILDATVGLAGDAMLLAAMGHTVIGLERAPLVYEIVADGIERARSAGVIDLPELIQVDALEWLTGHPEQLFDVIYLDPMFEATGKQALPRKQMQLLRQVGSDLTGIENLFHYARQRAGLRVVVKRPPKGEWLVEPPAYSIKGQRVRFDIYSPIRTK